MLYRHTLAANQTIRTPSLCERGPEAVVGRSRNGGDGTTGLAGKGIKRLFGGPVGGIIRRNGHLTRTGKGLYDFMPETGPEGPTTNSSDWSSFRAPPAGEIVDVTLSRTASGAESEDSLIAVGRVARTGSGRMVGDLRIAGGVAGGHN